MKDRDQNRASAWFLVSGGLQAVRRHIVTSGAVPISLKTKDFLGHQSSSATAPEIIFIVDVSAYGAME